MPWFLLFSLDLRNVVAVGSLVGSASESLLRVSGECVTRQCRCFRSKKKMWDLLELELVDAVSSLTAAGSCKSSVYL